MSEIGDLLQDEFMAFTLEKRQVSDGEYREYFVKGGKCSYGTLVSIRSALMGKHGGPTKIKKILDKDDKPRYIISTRFLPEARAIKARLKFQIEMSKLPPEEQLKRLELYERTIRIEERRFKIEELEALPLPMNAVEKKLKEEGMVNENDIPALINTIRGFDDIYSEYNFDNIPIEQIDVKEIPIKEEGHEHRGWRTVCRQGCKDGYVIIAAYKELLHLLKEQDEDEAKEHIQLSSFIKENPKHSAARLFFDNDSQNIDKATARRLGLKKT